MDNQLTHRHTYTHLVKGVNGMYNKCGKSHVHVHDILDNIEVFCSTCHKPYKTKKDLSNITAQEWKILRKNLT